jgi:prepilin-type N-terminal cleavage/methylation domain-containing protein
MMLLKRAFTLVELLVVIAIIAILAAILFPSFSQALAKTRQAICASNIKQIGVAILLYSQDYDKTYMPRCAGYSLTRDVCSSSNAVQWTIGRSSGDWDPNKEFLLRPYLKNTEALHCPSERTEKSYVFPQYTVNEVFSVLLDPAHQSKDGTKYVGPIGRPLSVIDQAETLAIWEHNNPKTHCNMPSNIPGHWDNVHHKGFNGMFCDTHVKRLALSQVKSSMLTYWQD